MLLMLSTCAYSRPFTMSEKKLVLKEFSKFQNALKKKDAATLSTYISYPFTDNGFRNWKNKAEFIKDFKNPEEQIFMYMEELKVNSNTGEIINLEDRVIEDKEYGNYNLRVGGVFFDPKEDEYFGSMAGISKEDEIFLVEVNMYNDLTDGSSYYVFALKNNKLKLVSHFALP